jgi:predicted O-methyltransferase YrrM
VTKGGIWAYLAERGVRPTEGSATPAEIEYLIALVNDARLIGEVGFNAGVSCDAFLRASPAHVVSFDIGEHDYVRIAKEFIDERFPGRHTLILGDSKKTIPRFAQENPETRFDVVFVDGGHDYETAKADLVNLRPLSHERTAVLMDDLMPWLEYGEGPSRAWEDVISEGLLREEELFQDGERVERVAPPAERAWALGRYR